MIMYKVIGASKELLSTVNFWKAQQLLLEKIRRKRFKYGSFFLKKNYQSYRVEAWEGEKKLGALHFFDIMDIVWSVQMKIKWRSLKRFTAYIPRDTLKKFLELSRPNDLRLNKLRNWLRAHPVTVSRIARGTFKRPMRLAA